MPRYDFEQEPDDLRSESIRKPQDSSERRDHSSVRGQGGGSGNGSSHQREHPTSRANHRDTRHESVRENEDIRDDRSKHLKLEREPAYDLTDSEVRTLTDLGTFRSVKFEDLVQFRYNNNQQAARTELNRLARNGFIRRQTRGHSRSEQFALTRLGHRTLTAHKDKDSSQTFYDGFVKWREADHDTAVYKLYQKAADDIARSGGKVTRVVLDFELKRNINRQLAKTSTLSLEEQAQRKQEIAEEHGLKVIQGRVVIPDLRLEYETADHDPARVDLEVVTGHYRARDLAAKAGAGFSMYASDSDRAHLRSAMTDPEIMQEILSL